MTDSCRMMDNSPGTARAVPTPYSMSGAPAGCVENGPSSSPLPRGATAGFEPSFVPRRHTPFPLHRIHAKCPAAVPGRAKTHC